VLIAGALVRSIGLLVRGSVKLPRSRVGENLTMQGRQGLQDLPSGPVKPGPPGGKFRVRFTTKMPPRANEVFSWLPILVSWGCLG
jgi:hypothetical protein